jgi:catechol 2,3-dioxygenase-like lactoylglutathione lyase family enzyme
VDFYIELNHTIVWCRDNQKSARFLVEILGLPSATPFGPMLVVRLDNGVSLDFYEREGAIASQHYASLVSDGEFDQISTRIAAPKHVELAHALDVHRTLAEETFTEQVDAALDDGIGDDVLRLIFTACHPVLSADARAKRMLAEAHVPFEVPRGTDLAPPPRLSARGHLPDLQRGLCGHRRRRLDAIRFDGRKRP